MEFITLANGDSREITYYFLDKIHSICPWCEYVMVTETGCQNPGCWAVYTDPETLQAALNKESERQAAEAERQKFLEIRNKAYGEHKSD